MKRIVLLSIVALGLSGTARSQGGASQTGTVTGNVQMLWQSYSEDPAIGAIVPPEKTGFNAFGNLIYNQPLTNYHFKCDYRFFGEQAPGASSWAFANSGAMLHGESPQQMGIDQPHPTSLEFQFLAQDDTGERVTGSICSPGTYLDLNGQTIKKHVTKSQKLARPLGEWVTAEVIIHNGTVQHIINGEIVIEYNNLRRDDGTPLTHGYISLQAESHPCQFRNIQLKILD